ncbi:aspartate aminotransferase family protein [Candidatus Bipolaricaulota bacterium]
MSVNLDHILRCHGLLKADFVRGEGSYLYDRSGERFIDFEAGIWCAALGHGHPAILRAIQHQSSELMHLGVAFTSEHAECAAKAVLATIQADLEKVVFLSSGSEAAEFGAQTIRRVTGKQKLLTFGPTYLGAYGSVGHTSTSDWHVIHWEPCDDCTDVCSLDCELLKNISFESIGGLVLEPGNSHGSVRFPPNVLVRLLAQQVKDSAGLLMANEVTTGFGRTGCWHGHHYYSIEPDVVSFGKGLGNGYPVSAVAMTASVATALWDSGFRYAQSHQNDPLGCAVAQAVVEVLRSESLIERSEKVGNFFLQRLRKLDERHECFRAIRGRGLMIAIELEDESTNDRAVRVQEDLLQNGFLVGVTPALNLLRFYPPLTIKKRDIEALLTALENALAQIP